jgi:hypothetical protein
MTTHFIPPAQTPTPTHDPQWADSAAMRSDIPENRRAFDVDIFQAGSRAATGYTAWNRNMQASNYRDL